MGSSFFVSISFTHTEREQPKKPFTFFFKEVLICAPENTKGIILDQRLLYAFMPSSDLCLFFFFSVIEVDP